MSVNKVILRNGEKVTQTEWHNITVWRGLAKVAENYIKKGMQLYIEGSLRTRSWEDKDGNKRYTTDIVANSMQMLGKKSDNEAMESSANSNVAKESEEAAAPQEDDDLPF